MTIQMMDFFLFAIENMFKFPVSREYVAAAAEEEEWVIDSIIPASSVTLITAREGVGKTNFAIAAARAVANGVPFLDQDVHQGKVLYMNLDRMRKKDVAKSLREFSEDDGFDDWTDQIHWQEGDFDITGYLIDQDSKQVLTDLENQPILTRQQFTQYIKENGIKLVIIDTLHKLATSAELNEDKSAEMDRLCVIIRDIARESRAGIIILHHTPVMDDTRGRGSGAIAATVDHVLSITGSMVDMSIGLTIDVKKTRTGNVQIFPIKITDFITLNPIIEDEIGRPIGAKKALIEQIFAGDIDDEEMKARWLIRFEKFIFFRGEELDPGERAIGRESLMVLFGRDSRAITYCRKYFQKEERLIIEGKGKNCTYIMHYDQ